MNRIRQVLLLLILSMGLFGSTTTVKSQVLTPVTNFVATESNGTKLRRLARQALAGNPWSPTRPYMKAVTPWQPSTVVASGSMVVNGGQLYACSIAGTTASSGGPTATDTLSHADNTAQWIWYGPNLVTSDPSLSQPAWIASTAYTLGNQVINNGLVYACVIAGTSAGSGGPTTTSNAIVDNTATWTYVGIYRASPYTGDFPTYSNPTSLTSMSNFYSTMTGSGLSAKRVLIDAAGSGYVVNDTITLAGGTSTVATVLRVTSVNAGAVTGVSIQTAGTYTVLPSAHPVAQGSTSGVGTGATFTVNWPTPYWCRYRGAYHGGGASSSTLGRMNVFQVTPNLEPATPGRGAGLDVAMEFYSDAPKLAIGVSGTTATWANVIIDGVRYSLSSAFSIQSGVSYHMFDFSTTSGRKKRLWRFENIAQSVQGVYADTSSTVWAPDDQDKVTGVLIMDSIAAGSGFGPQVPGNAMTLRIGHEMGWTDMWGMNQGGTGYINRGAGPGTTTDKYGYRVAEALTLNSNAGPDIWLLMGSTNDSAQPSDQITLAVTALLQSIRTGGSTAPIVVFGVLPVNANATTTELAVQAGVTAFIDPLSKTFFVPMCYDVGGPWITGTWNNNPFPAGGINANSTNATLYINASDNIHPVDTGTDYLVRRMCAAMRQLVLPNLQFVGIFFVVMRVKRRQRNA